MGADGDSVSRLRRMKEMLEPAAGSTAGGIAIAPTPVPERSEVEAASVIARKRLGEILVERGTLDPVARERTLRLQQGEAGTRGRRQRIGELLVTLGLVAQREVTDALSAQLEIPVAEPYAYPEFPILDERINARFLQHSLALPIREDEDELWLAMIDPTDQFTIDAFAMVTKRVIRPLLALPNELEAAIERLYGGNKTALGQIMDGVETRRSISLPWMRRRMRPSCGRRRSAMSRLAMILMREITGADMRLGGDSFSCSTPSIRYLTISRSSNGSM